MIKFLVLIKYRFVKSTWQISLLRVVDIEQSEKQKRIRKKKRKLNFPDQIRIKMGPRDYLRKKTLDGKNVVFYIVSI